MDAVGDEAKGAWPADLVARPCPVSASAWHTEALRRTADPVRARYHRAWLRHLADPDDPDTAPLVSVVIPVRDGNAWIGDAVGSALRQTWRRTEVVVVDDGSSEPPDRVLPRDPRLRILRQPPQGVARARNRGVREARGELVHLLDADDWLDPSCVARKVDALRRVPDADLCVASYRVVGAHREKSARTHHPPRLGDALCPTRDLLETVMRRYPFHTSTVLAARWRLLTTAMDETLEHGEDARCWFRLAVDGAKVVALRRALGTRRFVPTGLTSRASAQRLS
ncbi:MAG: glycosyltransferase, partial [Myxococcota bacterium]|nr:glycosyltransferase [Myxococcota bacterium]